MAYASGLGNLGTLDTTYQLLALLATTENEGARMELALTLARLVGEEHHFVQLLRQVRDDAGTGTSLALDAFKRKVEEADTKDTETSTLINECAEVLARGDLERGVEVMSHVIHRLPVDHFDTPATSILEECAEKLDDFGATRMEYVLLALHTMDVGWQPSSEALMTLPGLL